MNITLNLVIGCEYSALMLAILILLNLERNIGQNVTYSKCTWYFLSPTYIGKQDDKVEIEFYNLLKKSVKVCFNIHLYHSPSYIPYHSKIVQGKWEVIKFIVEQNGEYYFYNNIRFIVEECPCLKFYLRPMISFSVYDGTLS